jgi:hypothetical protein
MTRAACSLQALAAALLLPTGAAAAADGFVPFDPAAQEAVSGGALLIAAYAVVCGVLFLYSLSLAVRARSVRNRVRALESALARRGRAGAA